MVSPIDTFGFTSENGHGMDMHHIDAKGLMSSISLVSWEYSPGASHNPFAHHPIRSCVVVCVRVWVRNRCEA